MEEEQQQPRSPIPPWAWIIGFVAIFIILQFWFIGGFQSEEAFPISRVAQELADGNVSEIKVTGNNIEVRLNNEEVFNASKEGDLIENLIGMGISPDLIKDTPITIEDLSLRNNILSIVFSLAPILLLIWIFTRGFRQIQSGWQ